MNVPVSQQTYIDFGLLCLTLESIGPHTKGLLSLFTKVAIHSACRLVRVAPGSIIRTTVIGISALLTQMCDELAGCCVVS